VTLANKSNAFLNNGRDDGFRATWTIMSTQSLTKANPGILRSHHNGPVKVTPQLSNVA